MRRFVGRSRTLSKPGGGSRPRRRRSRRPRRRRSRQQPELDLECVRRRAGRAIVRGSVRRSPRRVGQHVGRSDPAVRRILLRLVHNWPLKLAAVGLATLLYGGLVASQSTRDSGQHRRGDPAGRPARRFVPAQFDRPRDRDPLLRAAGHPTALVGLPGVDRPGRDPARQRTPARARPRRRRSTIRITVVGFQPSEVDGRPRPPRHASRRRRSSSTSRRPRGSSWARSPSTRAGSTVFGPASVLDRVDGGPGQRDHPAVGHRRRPGHQPRRRSMSSAKRSARSSSIRARPMSRSRSSRIASNGRCR